MKKNSIKLLIIGTAFASVLSGCGDGWFERDPKNILTNEQVWNDPNMVKSQLANLYNRITHLHGDFNTGGMTEIDDAMWCGALDGNGRNNFQYGNDYGRLWDYGLMRDINMSIENLDTYGTELTEEEKSLFKAEFRFIRAYIYFDMVRRMGGVPLITSTLEYDYSGDPSYLQHPRAKEHEVYDFVYSECEAVKNDLKANAGSQTRANYFTALALESRAMLYAASIAKYNALYTPTLVTDGGEVGIPASMADDYYRKSLAASKEIIKDGGYDLYNKNADKGVNFYKLFMDKEKNPEIIWAKDYKNPVKVHSFGFDNVIQHLKEDNENSSCIGPSLGLVEAFDYLDGTPGTLHYKNGDDYVVYDTPSDIFANKDARLYGTIIYPGSKFRNQDVDIQAGVAVWNDKTGSYDLLTDPKLGSFYEDNKTFVGQDGPQTNSPNVSNTGFYIRKFISEASGYTLRNYAENWWPWFRLGEIYLNAAEAAFELNDEPTALPYINRLRQRAGFPANSLTSLTIEKIQNERRVELAFEDHRYFDMKRWRIADITWNGNTDNDKAIVYGLYPYRIAVAKPGTQDQDKYIFVKTRSERFKVARTFQQSNYYSFIADDVINNNPTIVKNPFQ